MPIKRAWRRDVRRNRVRRKPPQEGYLVRDLARLAGVAVPTVKRYVRHGLLAPVPFYGTATRYPSDYLVRVLALRYWRAAGDKTLAALRRRLDGVTFPELVQWVHSHPLPADTLAALRSEPGHAPPEPVRAPPPADELAALLQLPAQRWQRWVLMPGLELHLDVEAALITRRLAERLCRAFTAFVDPDAT